VKYGIDISPLTPGRTGVGNYVFYLLKNMLALNASDQFVGFAVTRSRLALDGLGERLQVRHVKVPTRLLYAVWRASGHILPIETFTGSLDLFHATNYFLPPARNAKRVVTIHDLSFLVVPQYSSPRIVRPFSLGIRRFAHDSDMIIAYSESTKRDVISILGVPESKIAVIYMAVDDEFGQSTHDAAWLERTYNVSRPYVLHVGTLEPRKNVPAILKAFNAVKTEFPHRLVLVGAHGWMYEEIFRLCDELNLRDRVQFIGFVGHDTLATFYRHADLFVFPSFYEGFGLPVLEAMKCGCPVIAARNSSLVEVAGGAALLVEAQEWEALAELVRTTLSDGLLREEMSRKGRDQAAKFSWKQSAAQTLELYRDLVGNKR